MWMLIRQIVAIAALPFVMTIVIPIWIARRNGISLHASRDVAGVAVQLLGAVSLAMGLALFIWSLYYFWSTGRGTLAPWDPPRFFVADGPYRFVRNPMISGAIFVLIGEALVLRSWLHAEWAGLFTLINLIYIPVLEEPMLAARFGEPYRRYTREVRRFVPRLRPWHPES